MLLLSIAGLLVSSHFTQICASVIGVLEDARFERTFTVRQGQDAFLGFTKYVNKDIYTSEYGRLNNCIYGEVLINISSVHLWYECENYAFYEELTRSPGRLELIFNENLDKVQSRSSTECYMRWPDTRRDYTRRGSGRYLYIVRIQMLPPPRTPSRHHPYNDWHYDKTDRKSRKKLTARLETRLRPKPTTTAPKNTLSPNLEISGWVHITFDWQFLSANQQPLLPFYGFMCGAYTVMLCGWLVLMLWCSWRDSSCSSHRVQWWIFTAILLGLLDSVVMFRKFKHVDVRGTSIFAVVIIAEWMSSMKYTSAKVLLILVSMGYGITRSSLGTTLFVALIAGFVYFTVCLIEGCLSVSNHSEAADILSLLVFIINVAIFLWILRSLRQSVNQQKLRKNITKLRTFKYLTGVLALGMLSAFIFMMWSTSTHKWASCVKNGDTLWLDDAYWSFANCVLVTAILVLVRPKSSKKRHKPGTYRFTALKNIDTDDEEDEYERQQPPSNDAFESVKMRAVAADNIDDQNMSVGNALQGMDGSVQPFTDAFLGPSDMKKEQEVLE